MCLTLSHNRFSVDIQLSDVIGYLDRERHEVYRDFLGEFPEWQRLIWSGSWIDAEAMGLDPDYSSWAINWIEDNTDIQWVEGEPYGICENRCVVDDYEIL